MSEWQDISTAPKDGTIVDLWIEGPDDTVDFYSVDARKVKGKPLRHGRSTNWCWEERESNPANWYAPGSLGYPLSPEVRATHWMPLPQPPSPSQEKSNG